MSTECEQQNEGARICHEGKRYVEKILAGQPRIAVMACEGGCIKGEVARVAANILAYQLERENAARICLGDAVTGDSGFVKLVQLASKTVVIEGCFLHCGTNIMKTRIKDFDPIIVEAIRLYNFDRDKYFEIFDIPRDEIEKYAKKVAEHVQQIVFQGKKTDESIVASGCCCSSCE